MITRLLPMLLFFFFAQARGQITISGFIASAENDPDVKVLEQQVRYLDERPYRLSPVQRVEFRTQNRELIPHQQEFAIRVSPANPWEVKNNNRYFGSFQTVLSLQKEIALKEELVSRYRVIINYAFYEDLLRLMKERRKLLGDQISILQAQSGSSFFDADDFVDLQIEQMDRLVEIDEASFEMLSVLHEAGLLYGNPVGDSLSWNMQGLIDLSDIKHVTDSLHTLSTRSVSIEFQKQKIRMASNEYLLEKANINAGFLQTEFDNRRREQGRTPFNISLGITIPLVNPNKNDMAKRRLDIIESEYDLEETTLEENEQHRLTIDRLTRLLSRYDLLAARIKDYEDPEITRSLSLLQGGDPRVVAGFRKNLIKLKILLSKVRRDIMLAYTDYLAEADHLQKKPLINFLSGNLEIIK